MQENKQYLGTRRRRAAAVLLAALFAFSSDPITSKAADAGSASVYPDKASLRVSGDQMVWIESDSAGRQQIHYRNNATGVDKTLTNGASLKDAPFINGSLVVWADKGVLPPTSLNWDIHSYDLRSGVEKKLNPFEGPYSNPIADGTDVVWYSREQYGEILYADSSNGQYARLGEGRFPFINKGKVVYKNARDGGLSMLDIQTGITRRLVDLGPGSYVDWFVFNDGNVLWKQKNNRAESKMVAMNAGDIRSTSTDLTSMSVKDQDLTFMAIGDTQAAWLESDHGQLTLKSVDLAQKRVYPLSMPESGAVLIGYVGDKLAYMKADGSLAYASTGPRDDNGGETGNGGGGSSVSDPIGGKDSAQPTASPVKVNIGEQGGQLRSADGTVALDFIQGTFTRDTEVSLTEEGSSAYKLVDEAGRALQPVSGLWKFDAQASLGKPAVISVQYPAVADGAKTYEKYGIYEWNADAAEQCWMYMGGVTGTAAGKVVGDIQRPGVYAVMLRSFSFADVNGHWAQQPIEVLAARGVIDGMQPNSFMPQSSLTRAQFAKLLSTALGLKPSKADKPSFRDVQPDSWAYGWIEAAAQAGLVEGDNGLFDPDAALTREQMTAMLVRAVGGKQGQAPELSGAGAALLVPFADKGAISGWAEPYVMEALRLQLIEGADGLLSPQDVSTRAQAAAVIYRVLGHIHRL